MTLGMEMLILDPTAGQKMPHISMTRRKNHETA